MPTERPRIPQPEDYSNYEDYQTDRHEYDEDLKYIQVHDLKFLGEKRPAHACYGPGVLKCDGYTIQDNDQIKIMTFKVGGYVSDAMSMRTQHKGDVGANSIARILAVLESPDGNCHLALHYFWRWGQIHQGADTDGEKQGCPRLTAPKRSAELFLQSERLARQYYPDDNNPNNALRFADGRYREVVPAARMACPVEVLTYTEVLARYPGKDEREALDMYEQEFAHKKELDSGARRDHFYWRYIFDHTDYSFKCDPSAFGGHIERQLLTEAERRMGDIFCGAGHMAVGARTAGFAVAYGVDSDGAASASFYKNTLDYPGELTFNPPGHPPTSTLRCTVDEFARHAESTEPGVVSPLGTNVGWLHFSPPCQNLSQAKKQKQRVLTGETLMVVPRIVAALKPAFVTLEEVPGFIVQSFKKGNMQVYRAARKRLREQGGSSAAAAAAAPAASESQGPLGDENSQGADDEEESSVGQDDVEGVNEAMQALQQQQEGGSSGSRPIEGFRPFLLVVPQLLDEGYQVRMCMLECAQYGLPSKRVRIFLYAAKHGYQLPTPPAPRYEAPRDAQRFFVDSQKGKLTDSTFLPKEDADGQNADASAWYDVLTAHLESVGDGELLPPVTLLEALGDLPPIMAPHHPATTTPSSGSSGASSSRQLRSAAAAAAGAASPPWRCVGVGSGSSRLVKGALQSHLDSVREEGQKAAEEAHAAKGGDKVSVQFGELQCRYNPQAAVMPYLLAGIPTAAPVADLTPVSAFAQFCRMPHYTGQPLRGFIPGTLSGHAFVCPRTVPLHLPSDPTDDAVMKPLGTVGTVVGKNYSGVNGSKKGTSSVHFAEPRMLTHRERARCQGCPDWLHYEGCNDKQRDQQVGNAVPYPVAVEVAGSVWEAATGQPYSGLPILKGPSPAGIGLAEAASARWKGWWEGLQPEGKHEVVLGWKEAMMDGGLRELKEPQRMQNEKRKKGQQVSRPGKRSRTSTPAASGKGSAGAAAADSGAAGGSMEESASQQ